MFTAIIPAYLGYKQAISQINSKHNESSSGYEQTVRAIDQLQDELKILNDRLNDLSQSRHRLLEVKEQTLVKMPMIPIETKSINTPIRPLLRLPRNLQKAAELR